MGKRTTGAVFAILGVLSGWAGLAEAQEPAAPVGPVAYWKFDEPAGTNAANQVGGAPAGTHSATGVTISNSVPPLVTYKNDHSLSFNGTSGVLQVPQFGTFTEMTVSCWVYRTGAPGGRQTIFSYKENNSGFVLCLNDGGPEYPRIYVHQGGWVAKDQAITLNTTQWYHLAATYDGRVGITALRLFVDGIEAAAASTIANNMSNLSNQSGIGARSSWDQHWYQGLIDDVRVYSRALTTNEVQILAAGCPVPQNLTATPTTGPVTLTWAAPAGVNPGYTYNIKRGTISGTYPTQVATMFNGTTYVDNTVTVGNSYYYVVTAVSAAESGNSYEAVADPPVSARPNTGLFTSEVPTSTSFNIQFHAAVPAGTTVTLTITSSKPGEGTVSDGVTSGGQIFHDVMGPQIAGYTLPITVMGVNDLIADGPQNYTVTVTTSSANLTFNNLSIPPVNVTNNDDDTPNITFSKTVGLITSESGGSDTFTVSLATQPSATVTMNLSSSNTAEVTVSPSFLTFNSGNWNSAQQVTVTGVDDALLDFTQPFTITTGPLTGAPEYAAIPTPDPTGVNLDNEVIPKAPGAWGSRNGGCGLLGLEIGLPLLLLGLWRRRRD